MQSISVFLDITKLADFWRKNANISRSQEVCHVIHIFFKSSLGKSIAVPGFIIVGYVWQILGRGSLFGATIREQPRKCLSWIGFSFCGILWDNKKNIFMPFLLNVNNSPLFLKLVWEHPKPIRNNLPIFTQTFI